MHTKACYHFEVYTDNGDEIEVGHVFAWDSGAGQQIVRDYFCTERRGRFYEFIQFYETNLSPLAIGPKDKHHILGR